MADLKQQQIDDLRKQVVELQKQLAPTNRNSVVYIPLTPPDREKLRLMKQDLRKLTGSKASYTDVISWLREIELVYFQKIEQQKDYLDQMKADINKHQDILQSAQIDVNAVTIPDQLKQLEDEQDKLDAQCENPLK